MRIQTKRNLVRAATFTALACTAAVILMPGAASAAPATAVSSINVRPSPSTQYAPVDKLYAGEQIDVKGCRGGWCYITHDGPDGYVLAQYLRSNGGAVSPNFNLNFNFPGLGVTLGNGGVSVGVGPQGPNDDDDDGPRRPGMGGPGGPGMGGPGGPGNGGPRPGPGGPRPGPGGPNGGQAALGGDVCFYSGAGYTGSQYCLDQGASVPFVGSAWNNRISSFRNPQGLRVTVCDDAGFDDCRTYSTSASTLGSLNDSISSIRIR